jgi:hypothetical protein
MKVACMPGAILAGILRSGAREIYSLLQIKSLSAKQFERQKARHVGSSTAFFILFHFPAKRITRQGFEPFPWLPKRRLEVIFHCTSSMGMGNCLVF